MLTAARFKKHGFGGSFWGFPLIGAKLVDALVE